MVDTPPPSIPPAPPPFSQPATPDPGPPQRSFLSRLFDLSFSEFVTPSLIKIIFVLGIVFAALVSISIFIAFAAQGGGGIVLGLLIAPLAFVAYVLIARVLSEIYLILFKIEENTRS